jgi:hypothetical protein
VIHKMSFATPRHLLSCVSAGASLARACCAWAASWSALPDR